MHANSAVKSPDGSEASHMSEIQFLHSAWSHDVADGYMSGCASGEAAAIAYIQYANRREEVGGGNLQHAAIYFAEKFAEAATSGEAAALRGKMVGFFSILDRWIDFAVKNGTSSVTTVPAREIVEKLEDAANGGPDRRWEEHMSDIRRAQARAAANARWSKAKTIG
jgi:hypothetical protein